MSKTIRGFTLIEVMITVAIVGILAAVAYPSYTDYIMRSNRNVAKGDLMEYQQWMERNYSLTNTYATLPNGNAVTLPFTQSPRSGTAHYAITFSVAPTATAYTLSAAPTSAMQLKDVSCLTLTLSSAGIKGAKGATGNTTAVNDCWNR